MSSARTLDELRRTAEELRAAFAEERRAISTLDHARLEYLARHKQTVAQALHDLATHLMPEAGPEIRRLFEALRVEAQASAMLVAAATQAVHALLGYDTSGVYDRRARRASHGPRRNLVTY